MWRSNGALELRDGFSVDLFIFLIDTVRVYYIWFSPFSAIVMESVVA